MMSSPDGSQPITGSLDEHLDDRHPFRGLSSSALRAFERIKYTIHFLKGVSVFLEGASPRGIYILCQGRAKLLMGVEKQSHRRIIRISGAYEMLGLAEAVANRRYEATAETLTPCRTDFVALDDFTGFLRDHPEACFRVVELLGHTVRRIYQDAYLFDDHRSPLQRLSRFLLDWCEAEGEETVDGTRFELYLTQRDLSQMIGASRETVARLFKRLRDARIVAAVGSSLLIRDRRALEELSQHGLHSRLDGRTSP